MRWGASSSRDGSRARTAAASTTGRWLGSPEIDEDRRALQDLMKRLGVGGDPFKILAVVGAERVGRLKLNGKLFRYSPLSRLEELEFLLVGVEGKLALWRALKATIADDPRVAPLDFEELIKRADSQRRRLARLRMRAAEEALSGER